MTANQILVKMAVFAQTLRMILNAPALLATRTKSVFQLPILVNPTLALTEVDVSTASTGERFFHFMFNSKLDSHF